jgi:transcription factor MBP1
MIGTWVPFERGIELSAQYKVDHLLKPIFDYVPLSGDSPPPAPKHVTAASTKPRAVPQRQSAAQNHAPAPSRPSFPRQTEVAQTHFPEPIYTQQPAPPIPDSDDEEVSGASDGESDGSTTQSSHSRSASISSSARGSSDDEFNQRNGRKRKHDELNHPYDQSRINRPISKYSQDLLDYFVQSKVEELPAVLLHPPTDFDVNAPIDDEGHSALHWASAMGRLTVVRILCEMGADVFQANNEDQIPLVRSIMFTNNYDNSCFQDLITYLRPSITHRNKSGRTVFHQIAIMTSHRSKWPASKYYIEALIKDLCGASTQEQLQRLKQVLDYQDVNGDTAITICARNQARRFCRLLVRANADIRIPNAHGRTAEEYIQEYESQRNQKRMLRNGVPVMNSYISSSSPVQTHSAAYQAYQQPVSITTPAAFAATQRGNPRGFQTYISEAAIRATQKIIPQMTEHLESLATSFDAELVDKEADLTQAKHLLASMEGEIETSRTALSEMTKVFQEVDPMAPPSDDVISIGEAVLSRIQTRVDQQTRDLQNVVERGQARDLSLLVRAEEAAIPPEQRDLKNPEEQGVLANELTDLQAERRNLVDRIVEIYGNSGCGEKMAGYRRLIALCIGQRTDQVDGLLDQLAQVFSEEEANAAAAQDGGDVVMAGQE